jgi:hypothetical protein
MVKRGLQNLVERIRNTVLRDEMTICEKDDVRWQTGARVGGGKASLHA